MENYVDYHVNQAGLSRLVQHEKFTFVMLVVRHGDRILLKLFVVVVFKVY